MCLVKTVKAHGMGKQRNMIEKKDVEHLATLSRLAFSDDELQAFRDDLSGILTYVEQIQDITDSVDVEPQVGTPHNVMREDVEPHEQGEAREAMVEAFPDKDAGMLKVKKILY